MLGLLQEVLFQLDYQHEMLKQLKVISPEAEDRFKVTFFKVTRQILEELNLLDAATNLLNKEAVLHNDHVKSERQYPPDKNEGLPVSVENSFFKSFHRNIKNDVNEKNATNIDSKTEQNVLCNSPIPSNASELCADNCTSVTGLENTDSSLSEIISRNIDSKDVLAPKTERTNYTDGREDINDEQKSSLVKCADKDFVVFASDFETDSNDEDEIEKNISDYVPSDAEEFRDENIDIESDEDEPKIVEIKMVNCKICNKKVGLHRMNFHMDRHNGVTYPCNICGKTFTTKNYIRRHKIHFHSEITPIECEICNKKLKNNVGLRQHMENHTGVKRTRCKQCGKELFDKKSLKRHMAYAHSKVRDYICHECNKRFATYQGLRKHKIGVHSTKGHCVCDFCGKTFTRNSNLRVHRRIHTGEKPFVCDICGAAFVQNVELKLHNKKHIGMDQNITNDEKEKPIKVKLPKTKKRKKRLTKKYQKSE